MVGRFEGRPQHRLLGTPKYASETAEQKLVELLKAAIGADAAKWRFVPHMVLSALCLPSSATLASNGLFPVGGRATSERFDLFG